MVKVDPKRKRIDFTGREVGEANNWFYENGYTLQFLMQELNEQTHQLRRFIKKDCAPIDLWSCYGEVTMITYHKITGVFEPSKGALPLNTSTNQAIEAPEQGV